ncbi:formate--tetrahydrofolate ligase [Vibrio lentus]|nr:formate--tetrahydrofolate ligase [Vibrio lentus]
MAHGNSSIIAIKLLSNWYFVVTEGGLAQSMGLKACNIKVKASNKKT